MEMIIIALILVLAILLAILAVFAYTSRNYKEQKVDYFAFFLVGIVWLPIGAAIENYVLSVMGLIFASIGVSNRQEWDQNRKDWAILDKDEKKLRTVLISALAILFISGIAAYIMVR
ncbi:MAG: hypothetical protein IH845_04345 [Nanoarchaeota archaeon]|nr:hypothetical protein [Nanoarchaeota archaeon]